MVRTGRRTTASPTVAGGPMSDCPGSASTTTVRNLAWTAALAISVAVVVFPTSTGPSITTTPGASRIASIVCCRSAQSTATSACCWPHSGLEPPQGATSACRWPHSGLESPQGGPDCLRGPACVGLQLLLDPLQAEDVLARPLLQHVPDEADLAADAGDDHLLERVHPPGGLLDLLADLPQRDLGAGHLQDGLQHLFKLVRPLDGAGGHRHRTLTAGQDRPADAVRGDRWA